jgi:hypothetical protein
MLELNSQPVVSSLLNNLTNSLSLIRIHRILLQLVMIFPSPSFFLHSHLSRPKGSPGFPGPVAHEMC